MKIPKPHRSTLSSILVRVLLGCLPAMTAMAGDALVEGFQSPPHAAKPRVWWHWMNGNVTEEGVKLDFEWMQRVGIGGVQNFDASFNMGGGYDTPALVDKPLVYLTPEWSETFRNTVKMAKDAGLEFTIASSAGWSETGGPWVKPQEAMKKFVWSETRLQGGKRFKGRLAQPPGTTGPFQNIPWAGSFGKRGEENKPFGAYYANVATLAYRAPAVEAAEADLKPEVTSSAGAVDAGRLNDGDMAQFVSLPFGSDRHSWIQFSYSQPQRIRGVTAMIARHMNSTHDHGPQTWLEAGDGQTFRKVGGISRSGLATASALVQTFTFAPVTARVFRVVMERPEKSSYEEMGLVAAPKGHEIAELALHTAPRVNRFEDKAAFSTRLIGAGDDTPAIAPDEAIRRSEVIDLTGKVRDDGSLDWTPPAGQWVVLRFGYSLTGWTNRPASAAGTGLEVDKLNRRYVKNYMDTYLSHYEKALGAELMGAQGGLQYVLNDSYEAGIQNWTDDLLAEFKARRGYDALPWLPVLAGRVLDSAAASDRFLWDFRQTLADLMAESHYGQVTASLHERGLKRYGESHEVGRTLIADGMRVKKTADVPMGATWATEIPKWGYKVQAFNADIRESASVAHIYGQNLVAAESLTVYGDLEATYNFSPERLKPIADRMMAMGLNRFVIHTSVHQPTNHVGPSLGLGLFGQWFTRKETWAEQAGAWTNYLSRSSYLLQQGRYVADIAYLYGEDANITALFNDSAPAIPAGYGFDFINADAVMNELSVKEGKLTTRSGMEYRVLALDPSARRVSLPLLRKMRDLVKAGAVVVGENPTSTPSLADDEAEFNAIVAEVWGNAAGSSGRVLTTSIAQALQTLQIAPDVSFSQPVGENLHVLHRTLGGAGELYYVASGSDQPRTLEASFRVSGRVPELWRAEDGSMIPVSYRMEGGRTIVPLKLEANDAVFVVFRQTSSEPSLQLPTPAPQTLLTLAGPWEVSFPPNLGAPSKATFNTLASWTEQTDAGVKYFSGTATYSKTLQVKRSWLKKGSRVQLDLGQVKNLADVSVNGRSLGVLWKAPFKLDVTDALKGGDNRLEIKVTNLWPNRLIGDKQPGAKPVAYAAYDPFKADSPLLPSGLLGPVRVIGWDAPGR